MDNCCTISNCCRHLAHCLGPHISRGKYSRCAGLSGLARCNITSVIKLHNVTEEVCDSVFVRVLVHRLDAS